MFKNLVLLFCILLISNIANAQASGTAITGPSSLCVGTTITLTDSVAGGKWSSSDSTIAKIDSLSGILSGVSTGIVIITYISDSGTFYTGITVNPLPFAGTITGPDSICAGTIVLYTDFVSGGIWGITNFNGTIDSTGNVKGVIAGLDTVLYMVSNSCGTDTAIKAMVVRYPPNADFIIGPNGVCVGDSIRLSHASHNGIWLITNAHASLIDTVVVGISGGRDSVMYILANSCGIDTTIKILTITPYPNAGFISGPPTICVDQNVTLTDTSRGGVWKSSNATALIYGSVNVIGITPGIDTISYRISNVCASDTAFWVMAINPLPAIPPITREKNILTVPMGYTSYQWTLNGNNIPDATTNTCVATTLANYFVVVTNVFGCPITSFPQTITELECTLDDMRIYPVPVTNTLYIDWCKTVSVKLTGMDGKTIKVDNINQVDLRRMPNGNYHLSIFDTNGNKLKTKMITKLSQ